MIINTVPIKGKRAAGTGNSFDCPARREKTVGFVLSSEAEFSYEQL